MKKASLISLVLLFLLTGQAPADMPPWLGDVEIVPPNPTTSDIVSITLSGVWGDTCIPNDSAISATGKNIYFDVIHEYPVGTHCFQVLTGWERTESINPLSTGTYTVYTRLVEIEDPLPPDPGPYEPVAEFIVTDNQFVLSTSSLTVPEGSTASFTVALLNEPLGTVEVTTTRESGDPDIAVESGALLTFDPCNYSIPQSVTLAAAEDEDYFNGQALIHVSAPEYLTAELLANESDNDIPMILHVDANAPGNNNGTSWEHAFTNLQEALCAARVTPEVQEIRVAQGAYTPAEPNGNRNSGFNLTNINITGGYGGFGEPDPNARDVSLYKTILSGDLNGDDGSNFANNVENSHRVVHCDGTVALDGLTISGGNAFGGSGAGAGLHNGSGCQLTAMNCIFSRNIAMYGGGMYNSSGNKTLVNCVFFGNSATGEGGGIYSNPCNLTLINCTVSNNSGGGMTGSPWYTYVTLTNCIFWGNGGTSKSDQIGSGQFTINYSCIQGCTSNSGGIGNIQADPCFVDPEDGDYHLKSEIGRWDPNSESWVIDANTSLCIDAGNPGCLPGEEPDPNGNRINMGAYGGTAEASKSPENWALLADLTNDHKVDGSDLGVFVNYWLKAGQCLPSDLDRSQLVDFIDYAIFALQCSETPTAEPGMTYQIGDCCEPAPANAESGEPNFSVWVEGRYIHFEDLMYANCCPDELGLEKEINGNQITLYEIGYGGMCLCMCYFPITATLGPFEDGTYTVEVFDNYGQSLGVVEVTIGESAEPSITYRIDDCNQEASALFVAEQSGQTRFTVTVEGQYIHFEDLMYANCCPDELVLEMTVQDNLITIFEIEYTPSPCRCTCDFPVTATLGPFESGTYTLEVYEDYGGFIGSTTVTIGLDQ
jgi:predicted outer membrane repeat protein